MTDETEPEAQAETEPETKVLSRKDFLDADGKRRHPRERLPRKLEEIPHLGQGWVWAVSSKDRELAHEMAGGVPADEGHDPEKYSYAMFSAALRDSGENDSQQVLVYTGGAAEDDAKLIEELPSVAVQFVNMTAMALEFGEGLVASIQKAKEDFMQAEGTPSSSEPPSSASNDSAASPPNGSTEPVPES